jgi:glycosyltransferase involved in cell wall biosynthesis
VANLDPYLRSIAFARPGYMKVKLVGTLFQPILHYPLFPYHRGRGWSPRPKRWLFTWLVTFLACHRRFVAEILTLDCLAMGVYNRLLATAKVRYLPDYLLPRTSTPSSREEFGLSGNRTVFLYAGSISNRKGVREFVAALELAFAESSQFRAHSAILFAGRVIESRELLCDAVDQLTTRYPDSSVILCDRRVTDAEFLSLLRLSDVVCIPYIEFVGMSSLLAHAASEGCPVLGPQYGLLGELIRRHDLGVACDTSDPVAIKNAMYRLLAHAKDVGRPQSARALDFVPGQALKAFGGQIRDAIERAARGGER